MERKCLKDIITRSADTGEGPHFKQVQHIIVITKQKNKDYH